MVRLKKLLNEDLNFATKDAYNAYTKLHKLRPTTKVNVAGKSTTAGNLDSKIAKPSTPSFGDLAMRAKQANLNKKIKSGSATLSDKLDAHSGGLKVAGMDKLNPKEVDTLMKLSNMMDDKTKEKFDKLSPEQAKAFLKNVYKS